MATLCALALSGTPWLAGVSASQASTTGDVGSAPLRIGTYNIHTDRDLAQLKAGVTKLKAHVDVAGLQEITGRDRHLWLRDGQPWPVYQPPSLRQNPVIWNPSKLAYLSARESRLAQGRVIEDKHGGTMFKRTTYAPVVRLRHRATGQRISVINAHLLSGSVRSGLPNPEAPLRHEYYVDQMKSLRELAVNETAAGFRTFVTGDFNIGYAADEREQRRRHPYRRFGRVGMTSMWRGEALAAHGTHIDTDCRPGIRECGAYIDGVWAHGSPTEAHVLDEVLHSDHYPAVASYELR